MGRKAFGALTLAAAAVSIVAVGFGRASSWPAPIAASVSSSTVSPPLAIFGKRLARVDAQTLALLPGARIDAGSGGCASRGGGEACWSIPPWSFSPDASRLALARNTRFGLRSVRLVDVPRMRVLADLRLPGGPVGGLAWLGPGRLLAVQEVCCSGRQRLLSIDVAGPRVTARRLLWGSVLHVARTSQELVLLLARTRGLGPAELAVADRLGRVQLVGLGRVPAGVPHELGSESAFRVSVPGLTVDPATRRAFVVAPGLVAQVDLRTLAVSHHSLARRASLLARLHAWLEPAAQAKEGAGSARQASWLGGGILAVSGFDRSSTTTQPAGLTLVDTRSWRVKRVDARASAFVVGGGLLLVTGDDASGLSAYGLDGRQRFRLFSGRRAWVDQTYGSRAYVGVFRPNGQPEALHVVDLSTGRAAGELAQPLPRLLVDPASGWWEP